MDFQKDTTTVTRKYTSMMHDCAITSHYTILLDFPNLSVLEVGSNKSEIGAERAYFGVLPRHAAKHGSGDEQVRWFEAESCYCYHAANAWEEDQGQTLKLIMIMRTPYCSICEWTLDMQGESSVAQRRTLLSSGKYELPVVPQSLVGRKTRYIYAIQLDMITGLEQAQAVIKV